MAFPRLNAVNNAVTTLAEGITAEQTSFQVTDASSFPEAPFRILIDGEWMEVGAIDKANNVFSQVQRGMEDTVPAVHDNGATVHHFFSAGTYKELANGAVLAAHLADKNNPHEVTREQIGALAKAGDEMEGDLDFAGYKAKRVQIEDYRETVKVISASGSAVTINVAEASVHDIRLTANCSFKFTGASAGVACSFTLILRQDATGNRNCTWPAEVKWPDGAPPEVSLAPNSISILAFLTVDGGQTWFGFLSGRSFA